jgi:hypothetical protein
MKMKHAQYPLSILLILMLCTACELNNNTAAATSKATVGPKTIRTISYLDNGAVVPAPAKRQVIFWVEDSTKILMTYANINGNRDSTSKKVDISDATRREEVYDNLVALADLPDGVDIKPGKQVCVGSRSIDIAVLFSNGDTARFSIMGGARCDRTLCPPFWHLDSLANVLLTDKK